jgi:hypothetical protein
MGGCLLLLFFSRRIAASAPCGQPYWQEIMAFPPDLTEKPRFTLGGLRKDEEIYQVLSVTYLVFCSFFRFSAKLSGMSKLMPRLGGHMRSYRTATTKEDGAEAVEQEFKP